MVPGDTHEDWQRLKRTLSREQFVAKFPHPFLIRRRVESKSAAPSRQMDGDWTERVKFDTSVEETPGQAALVTPASSTLAGALVLPLVKAAANPYRDRISIGRAQNCDVVLRDPSVSKLHAFFTGVTSMVAELVDARSANKTRVNAKLLEPLRPQRVASGDTLIFGSVACQFLDAKSLFELL